ncbi:uncharacterized protein LOC129893816 [Solanum dulcamara]|uniref:uncharacterized protein LOC129893816 n=1 Tax=Solanum dulcamara TaxID=45834 RepID=UPI002485C937|nr:uncharacterized protein LOC129893816 [Solanum dulcamara]
MGKRRRPRKDETQKNTSDEGTTFQESQQQEAVASLRSGRVLMMKQEPKLAAGSALLLPPPGFAPLEASPSHPRYQTRKSLRVILGRCESITTTPRSPIRHVKASYPPCATSDLPAHLTTGISIATKETLDDSVHAELVHQSVLTNCSVLGVENQKQGQHAQTTPFPEVVIENNATVSKAGVVLNANATEAEIRSDQSGALPTKSMSLNLTRIAALMNDYSSDTDEVESRPGPMSVMVDGYRVKEEAVPVLQKIFLKYGDIAMNSSFSSLNFSSSLMEFVCDIYKKLEETDFLSITSKEIQSMLAEVRDLEAAKIDVGWLSQRLNDISQAKQLLQDSCKLKEAKTRNLVVMETNKKELEGLKEELAACIATCRVLQHRIHKKEDEFGIARSENEKIMQNFADLKSKVNSFLRKSLVHDLL